MRQREVDLDSHPRAFVSLNKSIVWIIILIPDQNTTTTISDRNLTKPGRTSRLDLIAGLTSFNSRCFENCS